MMQPSEAPVVPLPDLSRSTDMEHVSSRNSWRQLVSEVPLYSERVRYNTTTQTLLPAASRSAFRTGSLRFSEGGIAIEGIAVVPNPKVERITGTIMACLFLLGAVSAVGMLVPALRPLRPLGSIMIWVALAFGRVMALIMERQRKPLTMTIPWGDVFGAQVDTNLRWITVIYNHPMQTTVTETPLSVEVVKVLESRFLTLNRLDAATIEGVAETIRHYAPTVQVARVRAYEWTTGRKIAFGFLGFVLIVAVVLLSGLIGRIVFP